MVENADPRSKSFAAVPNRISNLPTADILALNSTNRGKETDEVWVIVIVPDGGGLIRKDGVILLN